MSSSQEKDVFKTPDNASVSLLSGKCKEYEEEFKKYILATSTPMGE